MGRPPVDPQLLKDYLLRKAEWAARLAGKPLPGKRQKPAKKRRAKAAKALQPKRRQRSSAKAGQPAKIQIAPPLRVEKQEKKLTVADLPAIIELFKTMKISHLQGEGFELKLSPTTENPTGGELQENPGVSAQGLSQAPRARIEGARAEAEEIAMAQKLVDDPLGYEQAQIDAHLGRNNDDGGTLSYSGDGGLQ